MILSYIACSSKRKIRQSASICCHAIRGKLISNHRILNLNLSLTTTLPYFKVNRHQIPLNLNLSLTTTLPYFQVNPHHILEIYLMLIELTVVQQNSSGFFFHNESWDLLQNLLYTLLEYLPFTTRIIHRLVQCCVV